MSFSSFSKKYVPLYEGVLMRSSYAVWNRLELSPFSDDLARSLANEVRDPLWMLARQWQVGEFQGEDAGAPLTARLAWEETPLATLAATDGAGATPLDDAAPLEAAVESEPVEDNALLGWSLGEMWLRGLAGDAELAGAAEWFRSGFASSAPPEPGTLGAAREAANRERTLWMRLAARKRLPDGLRIIQWLHAGTPDRPPGLSEAAQQRLDAFGARFLAAHEGQFVRPAPAGLHDRSRFEYRFVASPAGNGDAGLLAAAHDGTRLDWTSFDLKGPDRAPTDGAMVGATLLPQPASFPGMPANRWWEFEDRRVDLGAVMAGRVDLARMLLVEFGLLYGNDWFVLPLRLQSGAMTRVAGVVVTDDFGVSTFVPPDDAQGGAGAGAGAGEDASSLFTLTRSEDGGLPRRSVLVTPPVAVAPMEGAATDRVLLLRDEMANMAWAVEQIVPDGLGGGMDARAAADRARALLDSPAHAADPAWESDAGIRWRLRTQTPDSWIPFAPRRTPNRDGVVFQQCAMPLSTAEQPLEKILPRSALLGRRGDLPFLIEEEEVPRSGAVVERGYARVRWYDGRTCVWLGRSKRNGRGPGSSGLAFDGLVERSPQAE